MQERGEMGEGTQRIEFRYDHLSRRYWKQTFTSVAGDDSGEFVWQGADAMTFVYDGWNCIEQTSATDTFHADFLWGTDLSGSHQGAGGVGGLLLRVDTVTHNAEEPVFRRSYPTYDGNGNVSEYLDAAGAVAAHFEYDAFGRTTKTTSAGAGGGLPVDMDLTQLDEMHRFSTKPLGQQTGFYYYGYRYYDPVTGRWPSRDPIGEEGGINLYGMVANDAISRWDYLGLDFEAAIFEANNNPNHWRNNLRPPQRTPRGDGVEGSGDNTRVTKCSVVVFLGHNDAVPQGVIHNESCSAASVHSCGATDEHDPAVPSSPIPGAPSQPGRNQTQTVAEAERRALTAFDKGVELAENVLCKDKEKCCAAVQVKIECDFGYGLGDIIQRMSLGSETCGKTKDIKCDH